MKLWLYKAAFAVWAEPTDRRGRWLPLLQHMNDAADVAGYLFDSWLSPHVMDVLVHDLGGVAEARAGTRFVAAVHDVGKACPAFAAGDELLSSRLRALGLWVPHRDAGARGDPRVPSAVTGYHLLRRWLISHGWECSRADAWAAVVGEPRDPHPEPGGPRIPSVPRAQPHVYGSGLWREVQNGLLEFQALRTGAGMYLDRWARTPMSPRTHALMSGVATLSDRIAGDRRLFPHRTYQELGCQIAGKRREIALRRLQHGAPWPATVPIEDIATLIAPRGGTAS